MSDQQRAAAPGPSENLAAAVFALAALVVAVGVIGWLLFLAMTGRFGDFPDFGEPSLDLSWRVFNWVAAESGWLGKALTAVVAVIAYGAQFYAGLHKSVRTVVIVGAGCLLGIVLSIWLMVAIDSGESLNILRSFTDLTNEEMRAQIRTVLGGAIVWFGGFLATLLRISWTKPAGAIATWLRERAGGTGNGKE